MHNRVLLTAFLLAFFSSLPAFAEKIDGPANIRDAIKGKVIFSLNDFVEITSTVEQKDWHQIGITISLSEKEFRQAKILKGAKIIDSEGKEIGTALADIDLETYSSGGAAEVPIKLGAELSGFTHKKNIRPESVVEMALNKILKENNDITLPNASLEKFIKEFRLEENPEFPNERLNFLTYVVNDTWLDDPSPIDRVRLIFEKKRLIAVIHSRNLNLSEPPEYTFRTNLKLTFLGGFASERRAEMAKELIDFYNSVD